MHVSHGEGKGDGRAATATSPRGSAHGSPAIVDSGDAPDLPDVAGPRRRSREPPPRPPPAPGAFLAGVAHRRARTRLSGGHAVSSSERWEAPACSRWPAVDAARPCSCAWTWTRLPLQEQNEVPYASRGAGRDARLRPRRPHRHGRGRRAGSLARRPLGGDVRVLFQPAEEGEGGAQAVMDDGVLDGVDVVLGIHLWNELPVGTLGVKAGPAHGRGGPARDRRARAGRPRRQAASRRRSGGGRGPRGDRRSRRSSRARCRRWTPPSSPSAPSTAARPST